MPQRPQINYINFIGTSSRILCSDLLCGFERLTHLCAAVSGVCPAHVAGDGGAGEAPRVGRVGGGRVARGRHLRILKKVKCLKITRIKLKMRKRLGNLVCHTDPDIT